MKKQILITIKRSALFILLTGFLTGSFVTPTYAQMAPQQKRLLTDNVLFTNFRDDFTNGCTSGDSSQNVSLVGNDNAERAFNYFIARGLTPAQSAGIVANLIAESGVDPNSEQRPKRPGGPSFGRGIAQWERRIGNEGSGRWDFLPPQNGKPKNVKDFAASAEGGGRQMTDLSLQLDFLWHELNNFYTGPFAEIKASTSVGQAASIFMRKVEVPADRAIGGRTDRARQLAAGVVLSTYGSGAPAQGDVSNTGTTAATCTPSGGGIASIVQKALELAWPCRHSERCVPTAQRPSPLTPKPEYVRAMAEFNRSKPNGADCGVFVATVLRSSGVDPSYPAVGTSVQYPYMKSHPEKYQEIPGVTNTNQLVPGDVLIVTKAQNGRAFGHTWIYIGPQPNGDHSASASLDDRSGNTGKEDVDGFTVFRIKQ